MSPVALVGCAVLVGVISLAGGVAVAVIVGRATSRALGARRETDRCVRCPSCGSRVHESAIREPRLVHPQQTTWPSRGGIEA